MSPKSPGQKSVAAAPSSLFTKARKAAAAVLVTGGVLASLIGLAAERIDPVAPSTSPISCSDPSHDLALAEVVKVNPVFELNRYAPSFAMRLGLLNRRVHSAAQSCSQDRENVIAMVEEMVAGGKLDIHSQKLRSATVLTLPK